MRMRVRTKTPILKTTKKYGKRARRVAAQRSKTAAVVCDARGACKSGTKTGGGGEAQRV